MRLNEFPRTSIEVRELGGREMRSKKSMLIIIFVALFLVMVVVACSADSDTADTAQVTANQPATTPTQTDTSTQADETVQAEDLAQVETNRFEGLSGVVYVYMPSPPALAEQLAQGFTELTGVEVRPFIGTTGEILARLEAEAANPIADVVVLASWSDGLSLRAGGQLLSHTPASAELLHPGLVDSQNTLFGMSASAVGVVYNTVLVPNLSSELYQTWEQLATDEFRGELAFPCPERSGSASDFLSGFINYRGEAAGWAVWETMSDFGMTVPGANAAALESVITGARSVLVAGVDWNAIAAINRGEPINFFYPAEGTVVNPRPAMILQTSNNLENAKAFMDFMLTVDAQQMIASAFLIPGRSDVLSPYRTNMTDMTVLDVDWYWMMENSTDISQRFNALMGGN